MHILILENLTLYCPDEGKYFFGTECRKAGLPEEMGTVGNPEWML